MNKLTKVGFSALCGSLAAIASANAGGLSVSGGADMSWVSLSNDTTGNPIGMGSNMTFSGAGELDNGWTYKLEIAHTNKAAYSATNLNIVTNSFGEININQGNSANGIQAYDDKTPSAWEEPWGAGLGTSIHLVSGVGTSDNIQWKLPTIFGVTLTAAHAPKKGSVDTGDKGVSGDVSGRYGEIWDGVININPSLGTEVLSGLDLFVGGSYTEQHPIGATAGVAEVGDVYEATAGVTYSLGPVSLGFQRSGWLSGKTTTASDVDYYRNNHYGASFNINDDLSLSWGKTESEKSFVNPGANEAITVEVESYQIAYTVGGASIRLAETKGDNTGYSTAAGADVDARTLSLSLAF